MTNSRPKTPKSSSIRTQRTSSGGSSGGRIRKKKTVKFADFSTPTTTRTRSNDGRKITYLVYRPLELDNESSSEPIVVDEPRAITYTTSPAQENENLKLDKVI